ncbi:Sugar transferase involved in LPS biosynthesis (colanic, teichoic acid) [Oceanobacillus limi]|uniref:Sugar transferase involved in LPS biosynthesis (Colanic, teichoic acid) n=2 Tax=Oceanobacillus limi TaxID=930131 RepID=A0A1I0A6D9_9BACI|nr:Sugar transferase involved in LPS biosynthesis (colanic, teichoic acid) [Oceanobacillus limi]
MQAKSSPPNFYEEYTPKMEMGIVELHYEKKEFYSIISRCMDICFSVISLPFVLLLIAVFSILIKLETPGPLIYKQERVGQYGRYFKVCKLRSMYIDAEKDGAKWAIKNDPRVTKVGKFMRRTRIDEIPQIINILRGDMTLVGPRPERPIFTAEFEEKYPGFSNRLLVKPGLTGLAQVTGGYCNSPKEKMELDLYYIENRAIKMDLLILLKTIKIVLSGHGAR